MAGESEEMATSSSNKTMNDLRQPLLEVADD